jgi:hypothetical protein
MVPRKPGGLLFRVPDRDDNASHTHKHARSTPLFPLALRRGGGEPRLRVEVSWPRVPSAFGAFRGKGTRERVHAGLAIAKEWSPAGYWTQRRHSAPARRRRPMRSTRAKNTASATARGRTSPSAPQLVLPLSREIPAELSQCRYPRLEPVVSVGYKSTRTIREVTDANIQRIIITLPMVRSCCALSSRPASLGCHPFRACACGWYKGRCC